MTAESRKALLLGFVFLTASGISMAQLRPGMGPTTPGASGQSGQQPGASQPGMSRPGMGEPDVSPELDSGASSQTQARVDDATLERRVHEELAREGELANVHATVKDGIAHLDGKVPSKESRRKARKLAESVPGVRGVKEKLTVDANSGAAATSTTGAEQRGSLQEGPSSAATGNLWANPQASDQAQKDIQAALQASPALSRVNAQVNDNSVILSGSVPSDREEEQALSTTQAHAAGRTIYNRMTVASAASSSPSSAGGITGAIASQAGTGAGRSSETGGQAAAGNVGAQTGGTTREQTNPAALPDIGPQIETALRNEPSLAKDDIKVNVSEGDIVLTGTVASNQEKQRAREIAESFAQERRVVDRISVKREGEQQK